MLFLRAHPRNFNTVNVFSSTFIKMDCKLALPTSFLPIKFFITMKNVRQILFFFFEYKNLLKNFKIDVWLDSWSNYFDQRQKEKTTLLRKSIDFPWIFFFYILFKERLNRGYIKLMSSTYFYQNISIECRTKYKFFVCQSVTHVKLKLKIAFTKNLKFTNFVCTET